jgi:hypothetical protein
MNKREAERITHQKNVLMSLGFTRAECDRLRRISNTLRRWHELECGTGDDRVSYSVERDGDEPDSKPYMREQYQGIHGWVDRRWPIADRETGARKRLAAIIVNRNTREYNPNSPSVIGTGPMDQGAVLTYVETDPRGAALYIIRPGDVQKGQPVECYYSRGICVY